ncbi:MAG: glycosyltransferase family 1 protein [Pseudomonas marincola]
MAAADTAVMSTPSLYISLISETFAPETNGVANTLGHLVEGLRLRGHRVQLVRPRQAADEGASQDEQLVLTRGWPLPGYPGLQWGQSALHKLLNRWRKQRPDVLYIATEGLLGLSALRAARRLQIPVVSGFHTNFHHYAAHYGAGLLTQALIQYLRWFHNRSQLTLVPCNGQKTELLRHSFERIELMARGVDGQLFNPARRCIGLRQSWGVDEDSVAVMYVGRMAPEKNLGLLATAFTQIQTRFAHLRLKLVIVGDGPLRPALQQQLPDAMFCGMQQGEALASHYASADLFLFPSVSETFGNVVLEALASGLGVVAFDRAGAAQHIRHGYNGALAIPGDEQSFIDAACWLLEAPENLRKTRLNARKHAARQGWENITGQFESHLRSAMQAADPVPAGQTQR